MKSTILLLLLFHSTCLLGQAAFFTDDFETQDLSAWSSVDGNGNIGSAPYVHSGQCSFRATLPAAGGHVKLTEMFTASSSIYLQFFFYIDPAWTQTNSVDIAYIVGGEQVLLTKSSGKYLLGDNSGGQGTHYISVGIWHSLQVYSQTGGGNGVATVWLDGAQDIYATNRAYGSNFSSAYIGFDNAGTADPSGTIYFDDVAMSTGALATPASSITVRYPGTNARSAIPVDVVMYGEASSDILKASVDGATIYSQTGSMTGHQRFQATMSSLAIGDHTLQVQLQNLNGTVKASYNGTIHKYVTGTPAVFIDENNYLNWHGARYFPVAPGIDGSSAWITQWSANSAVNTYGVSDCYQANYAYSYMTLTNCLSSIAGSSTIPAIVPDGNWTGASASVLPPNASGATSVVAGYASQLASNPDLLMWTWQDEPDSGGSSPQVSVATMLALSQATWNNDGNHPVLMNLTGYPSQIAPDRRYGWYYPIVPNTAVMPADAYEFDMYPFIYSYSGYTVAQMVANFDNAQRYNYNLAPQMAWIEAGVCSTGTCTGYGPTAAQVTMEAWLAVIHGIKGINWWGPAGWTTQDAAHWAAMASFVSQVSAFSSAILSTTPLTVTSNMTVSGSRVDATVREDSSFIYVFAARLSEIAESTYPAITANLSVSNFANNRTVEVPFESRAVPMLNGVITDTFSPSAVHLYCIPKSAAMPLPPCGLVAKAK
jgi:hypothetical protein